jgi:hypothetical protein
MARQMSSVVFGIVVVVDFQSVFHLEMHQNNIFFYFFKFIFDINTSKQSKNNQKNSFEAKKIHFFFKSMMSLQK